VDLSYFYAIVADFHARVQYLFSKPRYSVLMSSHLNRSGAARGTRQRTKRHEKQPTGERASERAKQPICPNKIRPSRQVYEKAGAGEGNRTLVFSLEGCCSTIELHPRTGHPLTRRAGRLNPPRGRRPCTANGACSPASAPVRGLTAAESPLILMFPQPMKGGDPVSLTKRCHLAGIAR
jgi:hypothetical protein